ncbi:hypothetical protein ACGFNU_01480 [Spirillospora sp. NPDC048911]|uniref:hypothetical protein n=1 Tax=Spirillospora sp. NPDC048911 TaxID=3364527 RepID=UPI00371FA690
MKRLLMPVAACAVAASAVLAGAGTANARNGVSDWDCVHKGGSVMPVGDDYVCYGGYFNGEPVYKHHKKYWHGDKYWPKKHDWNNGNWHDGNWHDGNWHHGGWGDHDGWGDDD